MILGERNTLKTIRARVPHSKGPALHDIKVITPAVFQACGGVIVHPKRQAKHKQVVPSICMSDLLVPSSGHHGGNVLQICGV